MDMNRHPDDLEDAFAFSDSCDVVRALGARIQARVARDHLTLSDLSFAERIVAYVLWFDEEVSKGGFYPFFANSSGNHALAILDTLRLIGCEETVSRFEEALRVFPDSQPARDHLTRLLQMETLSSEQIARLDDLSQRYFDQYEYVYDLALDYLNAHKAELL